MTAENIRGILLRFRFHHIHILGEAIWISGESHTNKVVSTSSLFLYTAYSVY